MKERRVCIGLHNVKPKSDSSLIRLFIAHIDFFFAACPLGSFIYLLMMPALCSQWVMGSKYREKIRRKFNLVEAPYSDCASHVLCPCCSLCQEYRELKARNLDPSLGTNSKTQIQVKYV